MIFANIPNGMSLFADANTFVFHLAPDPFGDRPASSFSTGLTGRKYWPLPPLMNPVTSHTG
jgi:hypothetical protein